MTLYSYHTYMAILKKPCYPQGFSNNILSDHSVFLSMSGTLQTVFRRLFQSLFFSGSVPSVLFGQTLRYFFSAALHQGCTLCRQIHRKFRGLATLPKVLPLYIKVSCMNTSKKLFNVLNPLVAPLSSVCL